MGSWNETCSLTNLPVLAGEPVYVMFLQETDREIESICEHFKYWALLPFMFEAEYDDYGLVRNEKGDLIPFMLNAFKKHLFEMEHGPNSCHDIPVKAENFDMNLLLEANREERLFFHNTIYYNHEKYAVRMIFMKKVALDYFLETYKYNCHYSWKKEKHLKFSSMVELLMKSIEEKDYTAYFEVDFNSDKLPYDLFRSYGSSCEVKPRYFLDFIPIVYNMNDDENVTAKHPEFCKTAVEHLCIYHLLNDFMAATRQVWVPPSGTGSQDIDTIAHKVRAKMINKSIKQVDHYYDDEG